LGAGGIERVIEVPMNAAEKLKFKASAAAVAHTLETLGLN
jgi:malate/lactate dehydrogenase